MNREKLRQEMLERVCECFISEQRRLGRSGDEISFMLGGEATGILPITQLELLNIRDNFIRDNLEGLLPAEDIDFIFMGVLHYEKIRGN